jgi:hypothetical protein
MMTYGDGDIPSGRNKSWSVTFAWVEKEGPLREQNLVQGLNGSGCRLSVCPLDRADPQFFSGNFTTREEMKTLYEQLLFKNLKEHIVHTKREMRRR